MKLTHARITYGVHADLNVFAGLRMLLRNYDFIIRIIFVLNFESREVPGSGHHVWSWISVHGSTPLLSSCEVTNPS